MDNKQSVPERIGFFLGMITLIAVITAVSAIIMAGCSLILSKVIGVTFMTYFKCSYSAILLIECVLYVWFICYDNRERRKQNNGT